MLSRRAALIGILSVSFSLPKIGYQAAWADPGTVIAAISSALDEIKKDNFQRHQLERLENIEKKLGEIDAQLAEIIKMLQELPGVIRDLLIAQYQAEKFDEVNSIVGEIFNATRQPRPNRDDLIAFDRQLGTLSRVIANFSLVSSPWVARIFAARVLACRFVKSEERFETAKSTAIELIEARIKAIDVAIADNNGIVAERNNFCSANEKSFLGFTNYDWQDRKGIINNYALIHNCPRATGIEFQQRGLDGVVNPRGWVVGYFASLDPMKVPIVGNPHDVRKEALNGQLGARALAGGNAEQVLKVLVPEQPTAVALNEMIKRYSYPGDTQLFFD